MTGPRRRTWPAVLALLLLAPFVAELLLGDIALPSAGSALVFVPLYGCGALLVREVARRTGRGWPAIAFLAAAYGVVEEAFATASLFDPDYAGLRLLDEAPLPFLGLGAKWTVYVVSLHVIWSVCTSIALAEALFPARAGEPWLRTRGLVLVAGVLAVTVALFAAGTALGAHPFVPTLPQALAAGAVVVLLVVAAFALPRRRTGTAPAPGRVPSPLAVAAGTLLLTSAVVRGAQDLRGWSSVVVMLAAEALGVLLLTAYGRRAAWTRAHVLGAAAGAVLTYAWCSFLQTPIVGTTDPLVVRTGNAVFTAVAVVLLVVASRRTAAQVKTDVRCSSMA